RLMRERKLGVQRGGDPEPNAAAPAPNPEREAKIALLRELGPTGSSIDFIAGKTGWSPATIRRIAKELGIDLSVDVVMGKRPQKLDQSKVLNTWIDNLEGQANYFSKLDLEGISSEQRQEVAARVKRVVGVIRVAEKRLQGE